MTIDQHLGRLQKELERLARHDEMVTDPALWTAWRDLIVALDKLRQAWKQHQS